MTDNKSSGYRAHVLKENRKKLLEYAEKLNLDSSKEDFRSQEAFEDSLVYLGKIHDKKKKGKAVKTSILVYSPHGLEKEDVMKSWLKQFFRKRWFYKFKYLNFLNKKEILNQF